MRFFDSHCHLEDERFAEDFAETLERMKQGNIERCVSVGTDIKTSNQCIAIAHQHDGVFASCGVHPHEAQEAPSDYLSVISELLNLPKVVALGEIGLDYHYDFSPKDIQHKVFKEQLALAVQKDVPVILHVREAHGDVLSILKEMPKPPKAVLHCFSGSEEMAKEYVKMGFYISFAGPVTYKKAPNLWESAKAVPLDRLLIETDSPYLAPVPFRGKRNEPTHVAYVSHKLAELKGLPLEEMAEITYQNACRFYRLG